MSQKQSAHLVMGTGSRPHLFTFFTQQRKEKGKILRLIDFIQSFSYHHYYLLQHIAFPPFFFAMISHECKGKLSLKIDNWFFSITEKFHLPFALCFIRFQPPCFTSSFLIVTQLSVWSNISFNLGRQSFFSYTISSSFFSVLSPQSPTNTEMHTISL